jgi:hypothetical protein
MATLFIKSLLTSLYQREDLYPSLAKRGKGRFSDLCKFNFETLNNVHIVSLMHTLFASAGEVGFLRNDPK